jgi:membrane-associated phospholipid phosphatase
LADWAAWAISNVLSPPMVGLLGALILALREPALAAGEWLLFGVYVLMAVVLPTGLVFVMVAAGRIGDVNMNVREERARPYVFAVVCMAIASAIMLAAHAPLALLALSFATCLLYALLYVISLRSKVSAHSAGMGLFSAMVVVTAGGPLLVAVPLTLAVMWARVRMRRHTWAQTVAGVLLGGVSFLAVWLAVARTRPALSQKRSR